MSYEEYRHPFIGPTGHVAVCHVRVYRPGDHIVTVMCEVDDNPGVSVTNAAEIVGGEVWVQEGQPPFDSFVLIEHYPPLPRVAGADPPPRRTIAGDFDRVLLVPADGRLVMDAGIARRRVFGAVKRWQHLELAEVEVLLGEPWTPIPIDGVPKEQRP